MILRKRQLLCQLIRSFKADPVDFLNQTVWVFLNHGNHRFAIGSLHLHDGFDTDSHSRKENNRVICLFMLHDSLNDGGTLSCV